MTAQICGVCHEAESKYKCPQCELRYCSLQCFRLHKPAHAAGDAEHEKPVNKAHNPPAQQDVGPADVKQDTRPPTSPYLALQAHPHFAPLFTKHPGLKAQLQRVYQASQNPYDQPEGRDQGGHNRRGRGGRSRDRVQGQWTQEKADDLAARTLVDLAQQDEGVKEFMELVRQVLNPDQAGEEMDEG